MIYPYGMAVNESSLRYLIKSIADSISSESDSLDRLRTALIIEREFRRMIPPLRDAAAYDARMRHSRTVVAQAADCDVSMVTYWTEKHRERTGAPKPPAHSAVDLSRAIDLSGLRIDQSHRPVG